MQCLHDMPTGGFALLLLDIVSQSLVYQSLQLSAFLSGDFSERGQHFRIRLGSEFDFFLFEYRLHDWLLFPGQVCYHEASRNIMMIFRQTAEIWHTPNAIFVIHGELMENGRLWG
jgi:hypothetical protein